MSDKERLFLEKCRRLRKEDGLFDAGDLTSTERNTMWPMLELGFISHVWEMRLYQGVDTEAASQAGAVDGRRYKGDRLDIKDPGNPVHAYMHSRSLGFEVSKAYERLMFAYQSVGTGGSRMSDKDDKVDEKVLVVLAHKAHIDIDRLRVGDLGEKEWARLMRAATILQSALDEHLVCTAFDVEEAAE